MNARANKVRPLCHWRRKRENSKSRTTEKNEAKE